MNVMRLDKNAINILVFSNYLFIDFNDFIGSEKYIILEAEPCQIINCEILPAMNNPRPRTVTV